MHRRRRNSLNAYFSIASIRRLEPIMKIFINKILDRWDAHGKTEEMIQVHPVFKACASDIITMYAFGGWMHFMEEPDYGRAYFSGTDWFFFLTHIFFQFPGAVHWVQNMLGWILRIMAPFLTPLRDRQDVSSLWEYKHHLSNPHGC